MEELPNKRLGIIGGDGDRPDREPPDVLVMGVGMPDPVLYRSKVATTYDKHLVEVAMLTWKDVWSKDGQEQDQLREWKTHEAEGYAKLFASGTDALELTIRSCRRRGVMIVPSYRMNAEDYYNNSWRLSDLGRQHPEWRIPGTAVLDPAIPEVYEHRMKIFREVVENYDVDGIQFNWRRWYHMISDPLQNHPILTRMVRETRQVLDEAATKKGRERLLLGVSVGPMLRGRFVKEDFPGAQYGEPTNMSCESLGLDVETWIEENLVDYVRPCLFADYLPGIPRTAEFAALARSKNVGIYPTVFPDPRWGKEDASMSDVSFSEIREMMRRHRDEICNAALQCYAEGADGIAKFNWFTDAGHRVDRYVGSLAYMKTLLFVHQFLGSPEALRECLKREPNVEAHCTDWHPV